MTNCMSSESDSEKKTRKPKYRDALGPGRYRKVATSLWREERFRALAAPAPNPRHLVLYLMTNPNTGSVPGLYAVRERALAEELGWPLRGLRTAFQQAEAAGFVAADWDAGLVWLPDAIHQDPPANPNIIKGWAKAVREMPRCALLVAALAGLREGILATYADPEGFLEAFDKSFREQLPETVPQTVSGTVPETVPQTVTGIRIQDAGYRRQEAGGVARVSAREAPAAEALAMCESAQPASAAPPGPEPAPARDADGLLPFERPPEAGPPAESLPDGVARVFREAKGHDYAWRDGSDLAASRELLSLAGSGGVPEVLRRWGHGVRATFGQRCGSLRDLVKKWNDNATPEERAPPARRAFAGPAPASKHEDNPDPW